MIACFKWHFPEEFLQIVPFLYSDWLTEPLDLQLLNNNKLFILSFCLQKLYNNMIHVVTLLHFFPLLYSLVSLLMQLFARMYWLSAKDKHFLCLTWIWNMTNDHRRKEFPREETQVSRHRQASQHIATVLPRTLFSHPAAAVSELFWVHICLETVNERNKNDMRKPKTP